MKRKVVVLLLFAVAWAARAAVVADSLYRAPLPNASVFDRRGRAAGICGPDGRLPYVSPPDYPITIRYIGYNDKVLPYADYDTVFLQENITQLPDLVVSSKDRRMLHILAYVREYSSVSTFTDTVTLFREKTVDFLVPLEQKLKKAGWTSPRVLASQSYYRFTDHMGLDSVSNRCNNHFSWGDWIGVMPPSELPRSFWGRETATDTVKGKYSAAEIWKRRPDRVTLDVDVLADTTARKWVSNLSQFFRNNLDFERFRISYIFGSPAEESVGPLDLNYYSFNIESNGRGLEMFKFNRRDQQFFVSTYGEVYVLDKQIVPWKEAKRLERIDVSADDMCIIVPDDAPELSEETLNLIGRVNSVDHDVARLGIVFDKRVGAFRDTKFNAGKAILSRLKGMFGIDKLRGRYIVNRKWKKFRQDYRTRHSDDGHTEE